MPHRSSGVDPESSLGWLLAPLKVETFLTEIWGQSHYHVSRSSPDYFDTLFDGSASVEAGVQVRSAGPTPSLGPMPTLLS